MDTSKAAQRAKSKLGGNNAPATIPKSLTHSTRNGINDIFNVFRAQISQVLPQHVKAERVIQLATSIVSRTPGLKECTTPSIIGGVMQAAVLGLDLTPQLGQCFLVPYNNKNGFKDAEFQIGYKGLLTLMRQTGNIQTVYAHVVRESDYFEYELGLEPKLVHRPDESNRGSMTHAYAVVKFKDGGYLFEVLDRAAVMAARARSKAKDSKFSPWNGCESDQEMMWRKTAIRKIANFTPLSTEINSAVASDGSVIEPDMFSQDTKELDLSQIPEAETEEVQQQPKESSNRKKPLLQEAVAPSTSPQKNVEHHTQDKRRDDLWDQSNQQSDVRTR